MKIMIMDNKSGKSWQSCKGQQRQWSRTL